MAGKKHSRKDYIKNSVDIPHVNSLETDALIKCTRYSCFPYFKINFKTLSIYVLFIGRQVDKQIDPSSNNERNTNCESVSVILWYYL